jgi:hypothetical protein
MQRMRSASWLPRVAISYNPARGAKRSRDELQKLRAANANASASSDLSNIRRFNFSSDEIRHAPLLERINSKTAFAAFTNGGAAAIIITQNTIASQAEC